MPPSKGKAPSAAMKNHLDEAAFYAQQAAVEEQTQQQIDHLAEQGKLCTEYVRSICMQKLKPQHELRASQEQRRQVVSQPPSTQTLLMSKEQIATFVSQVMESYQKQPRTPASQAPSMPPTTQFQASAAQVPAFRDLASQVPIMRNGNQLRAPSNPAAITQLLIPSQVSASMPNVHGYPGDRTEQTAR